MPASSDTSLVAAIRRVFGELSPERRRSILPLMALMFLGALAELISIGALLPFLAAMVNPTKITDLAWFRSIFEHIGADTPRHVLYVLTIIFVIAAIFAAVLRLVLLRATFRFVYGVAYELGVRLYSDALYQPYIYHTRKNSSELISAINKAHLVTIEIFFPLMQAAVAIVIASFIIGGLIWIDPVVAVMSGVGFSAIYVLTSMAGRKQLRRNSLIVAETQGARVQAMQEGLGGIRDIILDRSQPVFIETYEHAEARLRDARARNSFVAFAPRFIVEGLGMALIAGAALAMTGRPGGITEAIPVLGALALGAQRLLPLMQQIYGGWATALGNRQNLIDLLALLQRRSTTTPAAHGAMKFDRLIELDGVSYRYGDDSALVLDTIDLTIPHGSRVGIAGKTGSGKSTLMDLIVGLLEPTSGEIRIDGVALTSVNRNGWQSNIAHVPQAIFLSDATIAENIAFGVPSAEIDGERVRRSAEQAELGDVIAGLPDGYQTRVGERGIHLSGGQRQRIGIARALYKGANVLVFDEATSALDAETEAAVMAAIARLGHELTILIIAHRLSTLEGCDQIVWLDCGRVSRIDTADTSSRGPRP